MQDAQEAKNAMRAAYKAARDDFIVTLVPQVKMLAFSVAPTPLAALFKTGKIVSGYIPVASEADPAKLLLAAEKAGCRIALPHVTGAAAPMRFLEWKNGDDLFAGPFGLKQPNESNNALQPDIILVPLVAFDRHLNRLGQGAAHYDRALSLLDGSKKIGVAWSVQEAELIPADPWDIPLDAILTEREWINR